VVPMRIRRLSEGVINRIAAGEVIERPASVVKELVENSIDAGASRIDVAFRSGGRALIKVSDDGIGIDREDLLLAVERHATSKLPEDNLIEIESFGFRGEALPSIGAVARLSIASRPRGSGEAFEISVDGGQARSPRPSALAQGTEIEVRDLFFATPARLKFLKSDRSETAEAVDVVRRVALAYPAIGFSFVTEERRLIDAPADESSEARIRRIMGATFMENAMPFVGERESISAKGFAGLPTWSRAQSTMQYTFVNGRPVRDKLLAGAIRGAYADLLARSRYPAIVLFVTCPAERVDVNVHPAKAEVRFRDSAMVRSVVVSAVRASLGATGQRFDSSLSHETVRSFQATAAESSQSGTQPGLAERQWAFDVNLPPQAPAINGSINDSRAEAGLDYPLGAARAQVHDNYIVSQTTTGIVFVDQHAAHERLLYERMKRERQGHGVTTQPLLVPEVVDLDPASVERLAGASDLLTQAGLVLEAFGDGAVIVREVPAALGNANIGAIVHEVADELTEHGQSSGIDERINHVLAAMACHHSVRAGRKLRPDEMNALLREMEVTPNSGQCNHGRPTFIELKLSDIERLFGRR
jgi:DNA mismatch repair protein MutL